jgi:Fe-S cluster assembly ATPase SufC
MQKADPGTCVARARAGGRNQRKRQQEIPESRAAPDRRAPADLGLDIGAVAYVQQQLIAARDAGAAVLLISDDLDEVLTLGDRVAVMHGGHLGDARPAAGLDARSHRPRDGGLVKGSP